MGKYIDKFKIGSQKTTELGKKGFNKVDEYANKRLNQNKPIQSGKIKERRENYLEENPDFLDDEGLDDNFNDSYDPYIENIQPAQKPASFHHFILENQYKDLEKSIRGYKDVFNKDKQTWEIKRKSQHCFTDEESEEILRTAQSHLATDIKLTFYSKETFGVRFLAVYTNLEFLFKRIMEYRFGRFGDAKKQGEMKEQALKIFVELITRIEANYLRAIQGMENKLTHQSVQSQESLQGRGDEFEGNRRYS